MMIRILLMTMVLLYRVDTSAQTFGCTDPLATNFNASATQNDGSCLYAITTVDVTSSLVLDNSMSETSGLLRFNNFLWTHNDNSDVNLYAIDTTDGSVLQACTLTGFTNIDWEEIAQDSNFIYIGDFGNNQNGNRTDLRILRVAKQNLCTSALVDTIAFIYEDQTDFTPAGSENTDFDCEAFIVTNDSIFLFTKEWASQQTSVYALPKTPGSHIALKRVTYDIDGLVTGATFLENDGFVALCGYSLLLQPFVFLFYDYDGNKFFSGNKRKLSLNLPFHQIESIATTDGLSFQLTNEVFTPVSVSAKLHQLDLLPFTINYLSIANLSNRKPSATLYPNPVINQLNVKVTNAFVGEHFSIIDLTGRVILSNKIEKEIFSVNISSLTSGIYFFSSSGFKSKFVKE